MNEDAHFQAALYRHEIAEARAGMVQDAVDYANLGRARWLQALEFLAIEAGLDAVAEDVRKAVRSAICDEVVVPHGTDDEQEWAEHMAIGQVEAEAPNTIGEALYTLAADWPAICRHKVAIGEADKLRAAIARAL